MCRQGALQRQSLSHAWQAANEGQQHPPTHLLHQVGAAHNKDGHLTVVADAAQPECGGRRGALAQRQAAEAAAAGGGGGSGGPPQSGPSCLRMHSSGALLLLARTAMARRRCDRRAPAVPTKARCAAARGSAVSIFDSSQMRVQWCKAALAGCWLGDRWQASCAGYQWVKRTAI